ncbi:ABC transporter B family member 24, mitochondrial [Nosema granulosis]|uniref:ABC transporter B family member 24, mitochondrial n=1 Tax=Nosema granulosis TaxID=83296 RepID=A0A9P6GXD4_9MICR|nr:ABC transporter B family member 24, mitochondrial [Nosema granulosis]
MKKVQKGKKNSLLDLIMNYMLVNPFFKISFIPVVFLTYFALKLHNDIIESVTNLECYMVRSSSETSLETLIFYHVAFLFGHYLFTFTYISVIAFFICNNFTRAFRLYTQQYLSIKYAGFHSLGSGKLHSLIKRRANAVTILARIFMKHIYIGLAYTINNHMLIYKHFGLRIMLWNSVMYLSFFLMYYFVTPCIKGIRDKTNECYNIVSNKIFGIISNYDVIKAYNNDNYEIRRLDEKLQKYQQASFHFDTVLSLSKWGQSFIVFLCYGIAVFMAVYGVGFLRLANQASMLLYGKIFTTTLSKFESIGSCIPYFIEQSAIFEYTCMEDLELDDLLESEQVSQLESKIEFKNFGISVNDKVLLEDVNFEILKGEKVAIVGKNGCGKSTILNTLLRFVDYQGEVLIDGKESKSLSVVSQRSIISYIPQDPHVIEGTVLENIKYGNQNVPNEQIIKLCRSNKTHHVFKQFENGYSTNVGENGKFLSGGQKQQVSFMRAIVKDGDLYLVDEPTSNLDKTAESDMLNLLLNMEKKTVVMILHNPKFLSDFDKILGIHDQRVSVYTSYNAFLKDEHLY